MRHREVKVAHIHTFTRDKSAPGIQVLLRKADKEITGGFCKPGQAKMWTRAEGPGGGNQSQKGTLRS